MFNDSRCRRYFRRLILHLYEIRLVCKYFLIMFHENCPNKRWILAIFARKLHKKSEFFLLISIPGEIKQSSFKIRQVRTDSFKISSAKIC